LSDKALIAVIGTSNASNNGIRIAEKLGKKLISSGYRIISGGMGGIMAAVSRGGRRSEKWTGNEIIGLLPNWDKDEGNELLDIKLNTGLGRYRNTLLINVADAVIGIEGKAGTLSEIALAWQEKKPIGLLNTKNKWDYLLGGKCLDNRNKIPIRRFMNIEEAINWLNKMFYKGCFNCTGDTEWYHNIVFCIHRIHNEINYPRIGTSHWLQLKNGMSISLQNIKEKLKSLEIKVKEFNKEFNFKRKILITFDDGYRDILYLTNFFKDHKIFQPVIFIPTEIIYNNSYINWFDLFYKLLENYFKKYILNDNISNKEKIRKIKKIYDEKFSKYKEILRVLPYEKQIEKLKIFAKKNHIEFPNNLHKLYFTKEELERLRKKGWLIEPHGAFHSNFLILNKFELQKEFHKSYKLIKDFNSKPWLAYPDGKWNNIIYKEALKFGFSRLFTINNNTPRGYRYHIDRTLLIGNEIW